MPELRDLSDLRPAPYNPRTIDDEALRALSHSLQTFGDISGLVWNRRTGHLVCGHQRLRALREQYGDALRLENGALHANGNVFPIRIVDWDEPTEKAANIAANSELLAGRFTPALEPLVAELAELAPTMLSELRIDELMDIHDDTRPAMAAPSEPTHFELIIECEDEETLRARYERAVAEGERCRVLMW